ncbi:MAG: type I 3-dehydroquinate dehydratase [Planctomycetota bacterium]
MTRLCVPIFVRSVEQARRDAMLAIEHGADMVELRIDPLVSGDGVTDKPFSEYEIQAIAKLVRDLKEGGTSTVVTCRTAEEGGLSEANDDARFTALANIVHEAPAWVDLEWRSLSKVGSWPMSFLDLVAEETGADQTRFVTSAHDFEGRPENLVRLFNEMSESRADAVKLVWRARSIRDNIEAFELLREAAKPSVCLCMGEDGMISRVLAKKFGAYLTFASLSDEQATADGQVPIRTLTDLYRWEHLSRNTFVYGVIANPVRHSRSPHVHNAAFTSAGHDGVYLPLRVNEGYESFKAFMETCRGFGPLDLAGLSVTLPHKENALQYVQERGGQVSKLAEMVGAVNTITLEDGGETIRATNTDFDAILDTITDALDCDRATLAGKRVAILGAGGTGRCATAALASVEANVTVFNRTAGRAETLASDFGVAAANLSDAADHEADIWINTTSVGLSPEVDHSPLAKTPASWDSGTLVFDTIYNPAETKLMKQAADKGCRVVGGEAMFLHQAAGQFREWVGGDIPVEAMREAFRKADANSQP